MAMRSGSSPDERIALASVNAAIASNEVDCARQSRKSGYEAPRRSTFDRSTLPHSSTRRSACG